MELTGMNNSRVRRRRTRISGCCYLIREFLAVSVVVVVVIGSIILLAIPQWMPFAEAFHSSTSNTASTSSRLRFNVFNRHSKIHVTSLPQPFVVSPAVSVLDANNAAPLNTYPTIIPTTWLLNSNSTGGFGASIDLSDMLGLDELYRDLDQLENALTQKDAGYQRLVETLQTESEQAISSLEQWESVYASKVEQLETQSALAEHNLEAREQDFRTQMANLQRESETKEKTALEKIHWLADQLQKTKFDSHRQLLQAEQSAQAKQADLKATLHEMQDEVHLELERTESQQVEHSELRKERVVLEKDIATVQQDLEKSVEELRAQVKRQSQLRDEAKEKQRTHLAKEEERIRDELRSLQESFIVETQSLKSQMKQKDASRDRIIHKLKQEFQTREAELEQTLNAVRSDLLHLRSESQAKLMAEKTSFEQRESDLRAKITHQRAEIRKHTESEAKQSALVHEIVQKRRELEIEVATLRQRYISAVSEWEARLRLEAESRSTALSEQLELMNKKDALARSKVEAARKEAESHKIALSIGLKVKDAEHRSAMEKLRSSLASKIKHLSERLRAKDKDLQQSQLDFHNLLAAQKNASMIEQAKLVSLLREKEKELEDQVALTVSARDAAKTNWLKRMELERNLAELKVTYEDFVARSKKEFETLDSLRKSELQAAFQLLAKREAEAGEMIRSATESADANAKALERSLKDQENNFTRQVQEVRAAYEQEKSTLQSNLDKIANELQRYKVDVHSRIVAEKLAFQDKVKNLTSVIDAREAAFQEQEALHKSLEESSRKHMLQRRELENELMVLKQHHNASIATLESQLALVQQERLADQKSHEDLLAVALERARTTVDEARRNAEVQISALQRNHSVEIARLNHEMKQIIDSSRTKEKALASEIQSLTTNLQNYNAGTQQQLGALKAEGDRQLAELRAIIASKEKELSEQVNLTNAANANSKTECDRSARLENELSVLKSQHAVHLKQWESRYSSLLESRATGLQEAEDLLKRKENEARDQISKLGREVAALKADLENSLKSKSISFESSMQEVRSNYEEELSQTKDQLKKVCDDFQQFKFDAHTLLDIERKNNAERNGVLLSQIQSKDLELADLVNVTTQLREKVSELTETTAVLKKSLETLRKKHESEVNDWTTRYNRQLKAQLNEREAASNLLSETRKEAERQLRSRMEEAKLNEDTLQSRLRNETDRLSGTIQDLKKSFQEKEKDLLQKLSALEYERNIADSKAKEELAAMKHASQERQSALESELHLVRCELKDTNSLLEKERSKAGEVESLRAALELKLASLHNEHIAEVNTWRGRCDSLQAALDYEKQVASAEIARKEGESRERIDKEISSALYIRDGLRREIEIKESKFQAELNSLKETSSKLEDDLRTRLQDATEQLERYKVDEQHWRESDTPPANDDSYRLAEKVRYDLTKQLVKRNVEIKRQKAELKEKDAQISALRSGLDTETLTRTRLNLAAVKDRVAKILRRETEPTVVPYTFQHSTMMP